jgi:2-acylglycerol O-acyltransferase 2
MNNNITMDLLTTTMDQQVQQEEQEASQSSETSESPSLANNNLKNTIQQSNAASYSLINENNNKNLEALTSKASKNFRETLQLLAVIHHVFVWVLLPIISSWVPCYILFCTPIWWTMVLYAGWYIYDFRTPAKGSRKSDFYRSLGIWKHFADYFPITLVKTAELPPNSNYILGCHPHGVYSVGAFAHLCTEGTNFSKTFPGLQSTLLTLNGQFYFPFRREIGVFLGGCEASPESLTYLLSNPGKGRIVGIVVGGAEEALDSAPGTHNLTIKSRRGFCKFALKHGAPLVPSYSFGENDYYDQTYPNPRGSRLRNVQTWIKRKFGFCPPFFCGRGIFTSSGLFPYRRPVNTVVGKPIPVKQIQNPTQEDIDQLHAEYCAQLSTLFDENKTKYGISEDEILNMY